MVAAIASTRWETSAVVARVRVTALDFGEVTSVRVVRDALDDG